MNEDAKQHSEIAFTPRQVVRPRIQVETQIRQAIMSGELSPGDRLPSEATLASMFSVSRNTVREALRSLETQSLIQKTPGAGGGSFVRAVDHGALGRAVQESVRNLVQLGSLSFAEVAAVRQFLEVPAARLAAEHRTDGDLEELRDVIQQEKVASIDDPRVGDLDAQFHSVIARASGNKLLETFVVALHRETEPVSYLDLLPDVGKTAWQHHVEIFRAIEHSEPDRAEEALVSHLQYLRSQISDWAAQSGQAVALPSS